MKTDNAIVGVNFTKLDTAVINYVDFLSTKVPIKTVNNLFIFTARESFEALKKNKGKEEAEKMLKSIKLKMDETITPKYRNIKHIKNHAAAGLFVQEFYHMFNRIDTDLIVMGKENGSHGTMNKFIIRTVPSQTLIVPEGSSELKLNNIVIAIDQTDFSKKILKKALDFCSLVSGSPKVTCLHVGHMPSHAELAQVFSETHQLDVSEFRNIYNNYLKDIEESFRNFIKENTGFYNRNNLDIKVVGEHGKPYKGLMKYLNNNDVDLLIIGTKSHSLLDSVLLGSFAEKIIIKNHKVPTLIVR